MPAEPCLPIHFQLIAIWQRLLGRGIASVAENFFDAGGSPSLAQAMLDAVEQETGCRIRIAAFTRNSTIAGLADAMLAGREADEIVELQRGNGSAPFFYFHGDILGGGFYAAPLAGRLGSNRPFYVVPPAKVTVEAATTIEAIAAQRCAAIRERCPRGPYIIGGFCIEALVAYEVARLLTISGETVECVVLVDPELGTAAERIVRRLIERGRRTRQVDHFAAVNRKLDRLQYVWRSPLKEKMEFLLRNGRKVLRRKGGAPAQNDGAAAEKITRDPWRVDAFQWLAAAYRLKPYDGRVTILLTDEQRSLRPAQLGDWSRAASQLRIRRLSGRHMTAITQHRDSLAADIRAEIDSVAGEVRFASPRGSDSTSQVGATLR